MPQSRICSSCSRLVPAVSHGLCPACEAERTRQRRTTEPHRAVYSTPAWRRARAIVLRRARGQCEARTKGIRCDARAALEAHHLIPLSQGGEPYDLDNLVALCPSHHRLAERAAS